MQMKSSQSRADLKEAAWYLSHCEGPGSSSSSSSILPDSSFSPSVFAPVPVRWNIGALLMIQQRSFLYLSLHLLLTEEPPLVKLGFPPSEEKWRQSCAAWPAPGLTCYTHTHTQYLCFPMTTLRQIKLVSGVRSLKGEVHGWKKLHHVDFSPTCWTMLNINHVIMGLLDREIQ